MHEQIYFAAIRHSHVTCGIQRAATVRPWDVENDDGEYKEDGAGEARERTNLENAVVVQDVVKARV